MAQIVPNFCVTPSRLTNFYREIEGAKGEKSKLNSDCQNTAIIQGFILLWCLVWIGGIYTFPLFSLEGFACTVQPT